MITETYFCRYINSITLTIIRYAFISPNLFLVSRICVYVTYKYVIYMRLYDPVCLNKSSKMVLEIFALDPCYTGIHSSHNT